MKTRKAIHGSGAEGDRSGEAGPIWRDAVRPVKQTATAKFDETIEFRVRLGVDPRHSDQLVRGTVVLPHGTGQDAARAGAGQGREGEEARRRAPTSSGADEYVKKIQEAGSTSTRSSPRRT